MLDPQGLLTLPTPAISLLFAGEKCGPQRGDYCMNGITRQKVLDLCRAHQIPIYVRNFLLMETYGAEEAFLTGTFGAQTLWTQLMAARLALLASGR